MKKRLKTLFAVLMALVMVFAMNGCALKAEADEVFSGELIDAQNNRLVVKSPEKTMLFVTAEKTVYELGDEDHICVGDTLEVSFHKDDDIYIADQVRVTEHEDHTLVFGGQVTELEKHYITVRSESMTAGFDYDEETVIDGELSKGDSVTITYEGNISERPRAISIVVIEEKRQETLKSFHGTVSEVADSNVLVSMGSADAARFHITADTIINGDDSKLKVGDEVNVVYTGTVGDDPVARNITIKRDKGQKYYVMDGVIDKVSGNSLTVRTMNAAYKFKMLDDTRIQNKKYMEKGHKCTITYIGDLHKDPTAASVYCSKSTVTKKEKATTTKKKTETTKATTAEPSQTQTQTQTVPTETEPTQTQTEPTETQTQTEPTETQTEPTETQTEPTEPTTEETESQTEATEATEAPEPEPESVVVRAKGVINSWGNPCSVKLDGGGTVKLDISDADISGGYIPQENDQVIINYEKESMKLIQIQLEYRPTDETDQ